MVGTHVNLGLGKNDTFDFKCINCGYNIVEDGTNEDGKVQFTIAYHKNFNANMSVLELDWKAILR